MSKTRLLSGKIKKKTGLRLDGTRYEYLDVSQAEPDLGLPPTTGSVLISLSTGTRIWSNLLTLSDTTATILGDLVLTGDIVARKLTIEYTTITTTVIVTGDLISTSNTTTSESTTTGALVVAGGVGIGGDLNIGGYIRAANITANGVVSTATNLGGGFDGQIPFQNQPGVTNFSPFLYWDYLNSILTIDAASTETGNIYVSGNISGDTITSRSQLYVQSTIQSVSTVTGALVVDGGVGIKGDVFIGGTLNVNGLEVVTTASLGNVTGVKVIVAGTDTAVTTATGEVVVWTTSTLESVTGRGNSTSHNIDITNTTSATNTYTGALTVAGGAAVQGNLYIGQNLNVGNTLTVGGNLVITTASISQYASKNISVAGTDTAVRYYSTSGETYIWNTSTLESVTSRGNATNNQILILNTTTSQTFGNGALIVTGGVGIGSGLSVRGPFNVSLPYVNGKPSTDIVITHDLNTNFSTRFGANGDLSDEYSWRSNYYFNGTTWVKEQDVRGAWKVNTVIPVDDATSNVAFSYAPIGTNTLTDILVISGNGVVSIPSTVNSVNTTSGALVVAGGVGISGNVNLGNRLYLRNPIPLVITTGSNNTVTSVTAALEVEGSARIKNSVWVDGTIYSRGLQVITTASINSYANLTFISAGTDTAITTSSGYITVWNTSTLQSVTDRGNTTNRAITVTNATTASSTDTGALIVTGGVGIGKDLYVGGQLTVGGNLAITTESINQYSPKTTITAGTDTAISTSTGEITVWNTSNLESVTSRGNSTTNQILLLNSSNSIGTDTGALIVTGGVGIGKDLYVGGQLTVGGNLAITTASITQYSPKTIITAGTDTAVSTSTGSLTVWNTSTLESVTGRGNATNSSIHILDATQSTSTTTGALTIAGGLGVQGNVWIGGKLYADGLEVATTASLGELSGVKIIIAGTDTAVTTATGNVVVWNTSTLESVTGRGNSTSQIIRITNTSVSTSSTTGALVVGGGVGVGGDLFVAGQIVADKLTIQYTTVTTTFIETDDIITTFNTTQSTGTTTGALIVGGGVGIGGDLYVGGQLVVGGNVAITTASINQYSPKTSIVAGTDTAISTSTGEITIWNTSTLQSVTDRGNQTTNTIRINNTTVSSDTSTGALVVTGGVGIGGDLHVGKKTHLYNDLEVFGNISFLGTGTFTLLSGSTGTFYGNQYGFGALYAGITGYTPLPSTVLQLTANADTYAQLNFQNLSSGPLSSADFVLTADDGNDTNNFVDLGIASSTYQYPGYEIIKPHDGYLEIAGGDFVVYTATPGSNIEFWTGGSTLTQEGLDLGYTTATLMLQLVDTVGLNIPVVTVSTSTNTGALVVAGGVGIGGDLYVNALYATTSSYINGSRILTAQELVTVVHTATYITLNPNSQPGLAAIANTTTSYGTYDFGSVTDIWTINDYNTSTQTGYYSVHDAATAPGHVEYIGFTDITDFNRLVLNINYTNNSGHTIDIDIYNYVSAAWDTFSVYSGTPGWFQFALGIVDPSNYISSGNVTVRIYHINFGNTAHRTWIDYVALERSIQGGQGPRGATGATGAQGPQGLTTSTTSTFAFLNTTNSFSSTTGAVTVAGGVGIGGDLYIGGGLTVYGGTSIITTSSISQYANFTYIYAGTDTAISTSSGYITVWNTSTLDSVTGRGNTTSNAIHISNTTVSTGTDTGALVVDGGVGIGGDLFVGGNLTVYGATPITTASISQYANLTYMYAGTDTALSTSSGYITVWSTATLDSIMGRNNFTNYALGILNMDPSISTDTGALTVAGGVGIFQDLWVGGSIYSQNSQVITQGSIGNYATTSIVAGTDTAISSSTGAVYIWSTATLQSITDRSNSTTNVIKILNTASSTGTTTGALLVSGGIGVGGSVYIGGDLSVNGSLAITTASITQYSPKTIITAGTDTAVSTSSGTIVIWSTATLQSITDRSNSTTNQIRILNTASSTSTTTGALTVAGGAGIGGDLFVGGYIRSASYTLPGGPGNPGEVLITSGTGTVFWGPAQGTGYAGSRGSQGYYGSSGYTGSIGYTGSKGIGLDPWTVVTSDYTATPGNRLIIDTTNGSVNITLPATPVVGDYVQMSDGADWAVYPVVVLNNGSLIEGYNDSVTLDIGGFTAEFLYDGNQWQVTATLGAQGPIGTLGYTGSFGLGYTGSTGAGYVGSQGAPGNFGGESFNYNFTSKTSTGDPGAGNLGLNTVNFTTSTLLFIENFDNLGNDISPFLYTIDDSTSGIKGHFTLASKNDPSQFALFTIIGNHVHGPSWFEVPVGYVSGSVTSFSSGTSVVATFARTGDRGDLGYTGSIGYTGSKGAGYTGSGGQGYTGSVGYVGSSGSAGYIGSRGVGTNGLTRTYFFEGYIVENVSNKRFYIAVNSQLYLIRVNLGVAGASQTTIAIKQNNTVINTIAIPANTTFVELSGLSYSLSANDYLTVDITQSSSGSNLYVTFIYREV